MSRLERPLSLMRGPGRTGALTIAALAAVAFASSPAAAGARPAMDTGEVVGCGLLRPGIQASAAVPAADSDTGADPAADSAPIPAINVGAVRPAAGLPVLVRDINPSGGSEPIGLTPFQGHVVFSARDDDHGRELWITTAGSAKRLGDINPGPAGSSPRNLTRVGSILYFSAIDGVHGRELWRTDGTVAGTRMVRDIRVGSKGSALGGLIGFDQQLFMAANDGIHGFELWRSDGTRAGTKLVKDMDPGAGSALGASHDLAGTNWAVLGDRMYFDAHRESGELWSTDGTTRGTRRVMDDLMIYSPLVATSSRLWFMGGRDTGGCELTDLHVYVSDGTRTGTRTVAEPEETGPIAILGGKAYFGSNGYAPNRRLSRSGGTRATTSMVTPKVALDDYDDIIRSAGRIFFSQHGALAMSDGTSAGTHLLGDPSGGFRADVDVAYLDGIWYFPGGRFSERDLIQTDGTDGGTFFIDDLNVGVSDGVSSLTASGGSIWFVANDGTHGRELYRYDPPI